MQWKGRRNLKRGLVQFICSSGIPVGLSFLSLVKVIQICFSSKWNSVILSKLLLKYISVWRVRWWTTLSLHVCEDNQFWFEHTNGVPLRWRSSPWHHWSHAVWEVLHSWTSSLHSCLSRHDHSSLPGICICKLSATCWWWDFLLFEMVRWAIWVNCCHLSQRSQVLFKCLSNWVHLL